MLSDGDSGVRAAAIVAIGDINNEEATLSSAPW
jgi:HEAT repeat protein